MRKYSKLLFSKISDYKANKITREDLSDWAGNVLKNFLENKELIYYEKFEIYPFISELAIKKESLEFLNDSNIEVYHEILSGNKNMKYECYMKIPKDIYRCPIKNILELVGNYKKTGKMSESDLDVIDRLVEKCDEMEINTFVDFLYYDIVSMLSELPIRSNSEAKVISLFVCEEDLNVDVIEKRLFKTIGCYNGDRMLRVNMLYNMDFPIINISVC